MLDVNMRESILNKVSRMTDSELNYASADIRESLTNWKGYTDSYLVKLYFEFDSILDEKMRRQKK